MTNDNEPAFPKTNIALTSGLTKREYIASQCLAGLLSTITIERDRHSRFLAETAVMHADALLKELSKEQE